MGKRFIAAAIAAALVIGGAVVSLAAPSSADTLSPTEVSGNFAGDSREEVFMYTAGSATDYMVSFANQGVPCGQLTLARYPHTVNGTYYPVAGNFDTDAYDEIIWHAPGAGQDYLMNFPSFTASTVIPLTANGNFVPLAGDFSGDGVDDVIWYERGTGQDYLWDFNPDGTRTDLPLTINGAGYRPVAGSFGMDNTDDVLWYVPGPETDLLWDFVAGTHRFVLRAFEIDGNYRTPISMDIFNDGWRGHDILWYAPGAAADYIWDFVNGEPTTIPESVQGDYRTTSGDYFNDDRDDIVWMVPDGSGFYLWDHNPTTGRPVNRCTYFAIFTAAAANPAGVAGRATGTVEGAAG